MTNQDLRSTPTTIQIRQGASIPLSISFDFINSDTLTKDMSRLQSLIVPVIRQWWDSLTKFQRSKLAERPMSLSISARYQE